METIVCIPICNITAEFSVSFFKSQPVVNLARSHDCQPEFSHSVFTHVVMRVDLDDK